MSGPMSPTHVHRSFRKDGENANRISQQALTKSSRLRLKAQILQEFRNKGNKNDESNDIAEKSILEENNEDGTELGTEMSSRA